MKTFMQMYMECIAGDVVGPDMCSDQGGATQFSSDSYAPGDSRIPKIVSPMITRFGIAERRKRGRNAGQKGKSPENFQKKLLTGY